MLQAGLGGGPVNFINGETWFHLKFWNRTAQLLLFSILIGISSGLISFGLDASLTLAQSTGASNTNSDQAPLLPSTEPLDLAILRTENNTSIVPGTCSLAGEIVTSNTICQSQITIPSLWWAKEQFGGRLLENWLAYPREIETPARVDLVVNPQVWSLLDYLERYEFVNQFGIVASDYGYNTRIFDRQGEFLAAYTCSGYRPAEVNQVGFEQVSLNCDILLNSSGRSSLRGGSDPSF